MPGLRLEVLDEVGSTNQVATERASGGAEDGLVVVAERQTHGRGRLDRTWEAAEGTSLTFSLLLRPRAPARSWPWLPLLTGHAVAEALRAAGFEAGVKWPNDVMVEDRKVAGILVERIETPDGPAAVVGIGLNVAHRAEELPVPGATSLELLSGEPVDRTALLLALLAAVRGAYEAWQRGGERGAVALAQSYAAACVSVGRGVRVALPDGTELEGRATTVDPGGRLVVRTDDGRLVAVSAGDVVHVRPRD